VDGAAVLATAQDAVAGGVAGRKRQRGVASSEMAVKRFVAFVGGVQVSRVVMVGGVHTLTGAKRTRDGADERAEAAAADVVRRRDERGERRERREQRRRVAEVDAVESAARRGEGSSGASDVWCEEVTAADGRDEGAGGLGDRTGVG
jgi:hypothetical protein